jgi:phosphotransferase system enzyme I (PtsI)
MPQEPNPQLGWRSIRLCLDRPDLFRAQLRAIARASARGNVHMMFPLVSGLDEFRRVKNLVKDVYAELERSGVPFNPQMPIGTMIEVPAAVEIADMLGMECDFFSIGTNDLIQYSLAVDRVNERISHMYEPAHPAVLRMLRRTVRAARTAKIPCSICGEMAGDPLFSEFFVGLGVSSLSMAPVAIPAVRAEIANVRQSLARRMVSRVLKMGTGQEVRALLDRRYQQRKTLEAYLEQFRGPS